MYTFLSDKVSLLLNHFNIYHFYIFWMILNVDDFNMSSLNHKEHYVSRGLVNWPLLNHPLTFYIRRCFEKKLLENLKSIQKNEY